MDPLDGTHLTEALAHERFVRSAARAVLGVDDRVEDVVQESLVEALRGGPRAIGAMRAWLGTVARRKAIDVVRRDAARRRAERTVPAPLPSPSCDEIALREEVRRVLVEELLALDAPSRDVLVLRFYEDLPPSAVAARLGIPVETVRTRTRRAIERLRGRLDGRLGSRRAWALPLVAIAGLSIVPAAGMTVTAGAVGVAAGLLLAVAAGVAWLASDAGGRTGEPPAAAPSAGATASLAAAPGLGAVRGAPRGPVSAGAACGVVGYVTDGAGPARARVTVRRAGGGGGPGHLDAARPSDAPPEVEVESDATGRFVADGLRVGRYVLTATGRDGHARFTQIDLEHEGALVPVRLDLTRGDRTLRARVVEPDGRPARGWVYVSQEVFKDMAGGSSAVALDAEGACVVEGLSGGLARVVGSFEGRSREAYTTLPVGGEPSVWTLAESDAGPVPAARRGLLEGRVRASDGRTVGDVRVHAQVGPIGGRGDAGRSGDTVADADGRFQIAGLGVGEATVWVLDRGWMSKGLPEVRLGRFNPLAIPTDAEGHATVPVEVVPAATVRGRVVDEEGRAVARVVVWLDEPDDEGSAESRANPAIDSRGHAVTDADGRFEIDDAVPGRRYEVGAFGGDLIDVQADAFTAPADVAVRATTFDPGAWVEVDVVDAVTNRPLEGARVVLLSLSERGSRSVGRPVRTGADGHARVGPRPRGRAAVDVWHPEAIGSVPDVELTGPTARVAVRTGPSISGVVRFPPGAEPSGCEFDVLRPDGTAAAEDVDVDRDGSFTTGPLAPGRYRLRFRRAHFDPLLEGEVEADTGAHGLEVTLAPVAAPEEGDGEASTPWRLRLRAPAGSAVAHATLHVIRERGRSSLGFSGERCNLTITGDPIAASLLFTDLLDAAGARLPFAAPLLPTQTLGGEGGALEVVLEPERPIEGLVVGPDGRPLAGVLVTATPEREGLPRLAVVGSARTDAEGRFRIGGTDSGAHRLRADPPPGCVALDLIARGGDSAVRLAFVATASATVRVLDGAGRPVHGALVEVRPNVSRPDPFDRDVAAKATSDASGRVRIEGLDAATAWRLVVTPPSDRYDVFPAEVAPWPVADGEVRLERAYAVTGRVLDPAGAPFEGAGVSGVGASASTDADGRFVLRPLRAGAATVRVSYDWVRGPVLETVAGADVGDVVLERGVPLRIRVADWPGLPPRRASVPVECDGKRPDGRPYGGQSTETSDGTWAKQALPRDYRASVYVGPWPDGRYAYGEDLEGREEPHVLPLRQGLEITGRFVGAPSDFEGVDVQLHTESGTFARPVAAEAGTFRFIGIPPGSYVVVATRAPFTVVARVRVDAGATGVNVAIPTRR